MISESYLEQQKELHKNPAYGVASIAFAPIVAQVIRANAVNSIADYGAGKQNLQKVLRNSGIDLPYFPYDPAFPEYGEAREADLVCCIDVLEHIEPEYIDAVLQDLYHIMPKIGFFSVHTGSAIKTLPDGRNAHLTQQPASWWLPRLCKYFEIHQLQSHKLMGQGFWVLVSRTTPVSASSSSSPTDP
jgi:hypothetical protein